MADDATAALAAMDLVGDNGGEGSRKNSVEMPLADELTAGAVGFGDEGPEEVGSLALVVWMCGLCVCLYEQRSPRLNRAPTQN